jgi:hypothetical protein
MFFFTCNNQAYFYMRQISLGAPHKTIRRARGGIVKAVTTGGLVQVD